MVQWKAVSKHATWGRPGHSVINVRIDARLCGWCRGARGVSASSCWTTSAVSRTGVVNR